MEDNGCPLCGQVDVTDLRCTLIVQDRKNEDSMSSKPVFRKQIEKYFDKDITNDEEEETVAAIIDDKFARKSCQCNVTVQVDVEIITLIVYDIAYLVGTKCSIKLYWILFVHSTYTRTFSMMACSLWDGELSLKRRNNEKDERVNGLDNMFLFAYVAKYKQKNHSSQMYDTKGILWPHIIFMVHVPFKWGGLLTKDEEPI